MKKLKFTSYLIALFISLLSLNACSSDDDKKNSTPTNANKQFDFDLDGLNNNIDSDDDSDSILMIYENASIEVKPNCRDDVISINPKMPLPDEKAFN
jgi:hypothetical protein